MDPLSLASGDSKLHSMALASDDNSSAKSETRIQTSFGVLVLNEFDELLLAHVTGCKQWDIPKGGGEAGESPAESAIRETSEEVGLVLSSAELVDLGVHTYIPHKKQLHLFVASKAKAAVDMSKLQCTSFFPRKDTGVMTPEADDFVWAGWDRLTELCTRRMTATLLALRPKVDEVLWRRAG